MSVHIIEPEAGEPTSQAEIIKANAAENLKYYNDIIKAVKAYGKHTDAAYDAAQDAGVDSWVAHFSLITWADLAPLVVVDENITKQNAEGLLQANQNITNLMSMFGLYTQMATPDSFVSKHAEELEEKLKEQPTAMSGKGKATAAEIARAVKQAKTQAKTIARKISKYYQNVEEAYSAGRAEDKAKAAANADYQSLTAQQIGQQAMAATAQGLGQAVAQQSAEQKAKDAALAAAVSGSITKEQVLYREQCFLMANIQEFINYKRNMDKTNKVLPYQPNMDSGVNACLLAEDSPFAFMNKLTQYPHAKEFFAMTPAQLSNLVPMIRLYKVVQGNNGEETDVEFNFFSNTTFNEIQNYTKDKEKRGFGVGIKDFSFTYDGNNPFAAKKSIKAKLTLFANGLDELFMCRGANKCDSTVKKDYSTSYRYVDLALKTGRSKSSKKSTDVGKPQEGCTTSVDPEANLAKLNFRLKAVVGWAMPHNFPNAVDNPKLLDALNNSFVTLNLTPTIHDFDIDEIGRVNFTINYLAYIEEFFDQPQFNIFADPEISAKRTLRRLIFQSLEDQSECKATEINELKKMEADKIAVEKKESIQFITKQLLKPNDQNKSKMKYINLKREELVKFQFEGLFYQMPEGGVTSLIVDNTSDPKALMAEMDKTMSKLTDKEKKGSDPPKDSTEEENKDAFDKLMMEPGSEQIPFFYVSDLVDVILKGIGENLNTLPTNLASQFFKVEEEFPAAALADMGQVISLIKSETTIAAKFAERFKKFRVFLGPLEVKDFKGGFSQTNASIGDMPISFKYFLEWLTKKMLALDDTTYHLAKFLNDFFNLLLKEFMNNDTCFRVNANQKVRLTQATITSYKKKGAKGPDEITQAILKGGGKRLNMDSVGPPKGSIPMPLLNISGPEDLPLTHKSVDFETNYLTFFAGRVQPSEFMNGNRIEDEKRGLFHFSMGRQDGLVKNISLSKTTAKYLKEVRFEQDGYDGLKQLREVYDVTIDTFPIVNAYPGVYIYVEPRGWSPSSNSKDLTELGIGGYHMIWKSEHSFAPGKAESKIYAKWVASIGTCASKRSIDDPADSGGGSTDGDKVTKCGSMLKKIEEGKTAGEAAAATRDEVGAAPAK